MANTSKKKKNEPITNCDKSIEVIANCENTSINIESLIRTIRGQKVMVDFDLAMLYGVQNKRLNEQVKRNIVRFPDDFMFQLTKEEWRVLRSQIAHNRRTIGTVPPVRYIESPYQGPEVRYDGGSIYYLFDLPKEYQKEGLKVKATLDCYTFLHFDEYVEVTVIAGYDYYDAVLKQIEIAE
jgi:hypothetical protein